MAWWPNRPIALAPKALPTRSIQIKTAGAIRTIKFVPEDWTDYERVRTVSYESQDCRSPNIQKPVFCQSLKDKNVVEVVSAMRFHRAESHGSANRQPLVSIIIPCLNQEVLTAECLSSISRTLPSTFDIEVIIADNASKDRLYESLTTHPELIVLRFAENLGFGPACNKAAEAAKGKYLFFLNNDAQISERCIEHLVSSIERSNGKVGIVGAKLLSFDGWLQEAGCLLNKDGTGSLIGFGTHPGAPRFNYDREVEHVSAAAMLISRSLFHKMGGFDPVYAPAYCEDADLSMKVRECGLSIVYVHEAVVAHHLSATTDDMTSDKQKTKHRRIARNRDIFVSRWIDRLLDKNIRTLAFYLPQYHPIAQNDLWWGKGFTEWTNVTKAVQNFVGHNQPRYPADLGYYDLRLNEVMVQQADLARRYGLSGFCYYYYWFDGKRLLEHPLEQMLSTGRPDFPFCLCWANENWTRRWDGQENDVLIAQSYTDDDTRQLIGDLIRYFRSPHYIRIHDRPLILVYRIKSLPDPHRAMNIWRDACREAGIGEICVAMVESFELSAAPEDPRLYGCDITVEFPPHGMADSRPLSVQRINPNWTGTVRDYRELIHNYTKRAEPGFKRLRSVLVGWDNSPRHQTQSLVLEHSTPGAFQAWLEWTYQRTLEQNVGDERLVFINAWNEWCEGSYLEPDRRFGHDYLQALRNAQHNIANGRHSFVGHRN
ncbi:glycoside hydrolase family 99-like domain-containing protein [Hyphomicrobium sp. B1]|uniref:glycoside hydrolase family 99-like domain-containing protein n=1 Tax=Hyphomicrobium sp. B1 TaxID=3075651 RepID=UPI003C2B9F03